MLNQLSSAHTHIPSYKAKGVIAGVFASCVYSVIVAVYDRITCLVTARSALFSLSMFSLFNVTPIQFFFKDTLKKRQLL